jgi:hypothetical protein
MVGLLGSLNKEAYCPELTVSTAAAFRLRFVQREIMWLMEHIPGWAQIMIGVCGLGVLVYFKEIHRILPTRRWSRRSNPVRREEVSRNRSKRPLTTNPIGIRVADIYGLPSGNRASRKVRRSQLVDATPAD